MVSDAITVAKTMKLPNIIVTPNLILGSDDNFCMVSAIQIPSEIPRVFSATIKNLLTPDAYESAYRNGNSYTKDMINNEYARLGDEYFIDIAREPVLYMNIRSAFDRAMEYINNSECILTDFNAGDTEEFRNILGMKVTDGHTWYRLEQALLSFYGSLISANTSDKIFISLYKQPVPYGIPGTILMKCSVQKKKYTIDNYIKYRIL